MCIRDSSYVINNLASGILYDTYVNYLQEVSLPTATSFWAFYGYATFLSALILLLVPKSGYKKLLLFCAASTSAAFFCVVFVKSATIFYLSTLLALTGVQLHFIMLAPYVAAYAGSAGGKSIDWYTRCLLYTSYRNRRCRQLLWNAFHVQREFRVRGRAWSV